MVEPILGEGGQGVNRIHCRCKMAAASPFAHVPFCPNTPAKPAKGSASPHRKKGFAAPPAEKL
jgi:hypothetical protein